MNLFEGLLRQSEVMCLFCGCKEGISDQGRWLGILRQQGHHLLLGQRNLSQAALRVALEQKQHVGV